MKNLIFIILLFCTALLKGQCHADFEPNDTIWPAIKFWNYSEGDFNRQLWTFGDGHTATIYSPWNYYDTIGTYKICLKIWSTENGCTDSICKDLTLSYPCPPEYFNFTYKVYDDSVTFSPYGNDHMNLLWDFGDGHSSSEIVPYHIYADTGIYNTCLYAANYDSSCFDTVCNNIRVGYPGLIANFSYRITGRFVEFYENSYRYEGVNWIDTKFWNFGDNDSTDMPYSDTSIYHYFEKSDKYNVCLTISDWTDTQTSTFCDSVYIDSINCKTYFEITENQNCSGGIVSFINLSEFKNETEWLWLYGDGSSDTIFQPNQKNFQIWDAYWDKGICLYAIDDKGCEDKFCLPLEITCPDNIEDIEANTSYLEVFPNPVNTTLNIKIAEQKANHISVRLFNSSGVLVLEKNILYQDSIQINIDSYKKGFYFLIVQSGNNFFYEKLIIQ